MASGRSRLTPEQRQQLQAATVDVILELRALYLAAGASPLKHWEQLESRIQSSTRTTTSVAEWVTAMKRGLRLSTTSRSLSSAAVKLADAVETMTARNEWLDMVGREVGYIIAMCRLEAEDRKEQRDAAKTAQEAE